MIPPPDVRLSGARGAGRSGRHKVAGVGVPDGEPTVAGVRSARPSGRARGRRAIATVQDLAVSGLVGGLLVAVVLVVARPGAAEEAVVAQLGAAARDAALT